MKSSSQALDQKPPAASPVFVVSLEDDLLPNGLVVESFLATIGGRPSLLPLMLGSLMTGRLDEVILREGNMDFATLPWRQGVLDELRLRKANGDQLVLATRGNVELARRAASHLTLFDEIVAEGDLAEATFGTSTRFSRTTRAFPLKPIIKALRPHQWVKNVLVFVPIAISGQFTDAHGWFLALLAFIAFSLTASSIYLLNDLSDLEADRLHARKRFRPFASGALPVAWGLWGAPILLAAGITIAVLADGLPFLLLYAILSISYSIDLKKRTLFDVFALAALYTVRLYGGGEVSGHSPTVWLLGFSVFIFLSLALMKRMAELVGTTADKLKRRGYRQVDQPLLMASGVASSFCASLVLALYLDSEAVTRLFSEPFRLWPIVPMILFWQLKLWHKTLHGRMTDDPIVFAAKDHISWIIGALVAFCAIIAGIGN